MRELPLSSPTQARQYPGRPAASGASPALFPDVQSSALDSQLTYTRFIPAPQPVSSVKKWIAHSEGFAKGELHIDDCATKVLASDKAVSILPIGITDVRGEFEKDDIVRIIDFEGNPIGVGKANCSSEQAREAMGKHGKETCSAL